MVLEYFGSFISSVVLVCKVGYYLYDANYASLGSWIHLLLAADSRSSLGIAGYECLVAGYHLWWINEWSVDFFSWGNSRYTSKQFYNLVFNGLHAPPTFSWLWKANCMPRIKGLFGFCLWSPAWARQQTQAIDFLGLGSGSLPGAPCLAQDLNQTCPKCFGWLLILDRLNTRHILQRRNFNVQTGVLCVMCNHGQRETRDHLFF